METRKEGFPMADGKTINNITFADDGALIAMSLGAIKALLTAFEHECTLLQLRINPEKTKYMVVSAEDKESDAQLEVRGKKIEKVTSFLYLGSVVSEAGGCEEEIGERLKKAGQAYGAFNRWFRSSKLSTSTRMVVVQRVLVPSATYALEVAALRKEEESRLDVAHMTWLRRTSDVTKLDMIKNEEVRLRCGGEVRLSRRVNREQLRYWGHLIRMDKKRLPQLMYRWEAPEEWRRTRGRPKLRWLDNIKSSLEELGLVG
jgi:hypothetical protein